ncbi:MAG: tRNA epoxyqueuosine(34) reductase QueG [Bacteroidetes bacterium GWF2_42_66]|nr:MAG: tRNA epoxyqueuosine(34) reductase QueG [Bacteroidetes bacterium GWA2_42_15]OFY00738.1 MAG: tRNA epoxyqueuosine(34) reductase QueG [Bacteroidetes bacterium GWE2_42_39]OFY40763.1 MAG: tRNA epoxyqueuosine(34) reductase QueG [Bacteroidetes bacterium GWF2_42_66]HBL75775.1 tRNA epoxyqueuosine(34) reductase QueG [Prolixibacteraceae bacterium]HCR89585.1 tRNA epoxyqueuosine(34) reductase QueG [Prolixibacteraceae bacterium]
MTDVVKISGRIKQKAVELGFLACGISRADFLPDEKSRLEEWLVERRHGEMAYMERNFDKRLDPRLLVENARSVVSVLLNYFPEKMQKDTTAPVLSKYAYGKDYHFVMKDKLHVLLKFIQDEIAPCGGRVFVDSAPVLDRAWAAKAGLGWIGKNTNLISVEHGSFFFIGELIIDLQLDPDEKVVRNHCGNCTRCIDACPTGAIIEPFVLDARKCISYQTIEKKGDLDESLKGKFEHRVFGCDICQDVCPWNLKSVFHKEPGFETNSRLLQLTKEEWQQMDNQLFDELFKDSAVQRTGFAGLKRNLEFISE